MSIDAAISCDKNMIKEQAKKILKHEVLKIEIQRMCNMKAQMILVTAGATGTISKSLSSSIPDQHTGKARNKETTKKIAILYTAHKLQEVLM
jgi:hypothetical protein